ncbi:uncharacterized protein [Centruroides vittatus]|uniref:uncharacterized protein n=1 Tax=Centruroides vittatus TaxID=120091 RepID=UPI003510B0A6
MPARLYRSMDLEKKLAEFTLSQERFECFLRRNNLIISGLPESENENLPVKEVVLEFFRDKLNVDQEAGYRETDRGRFIGGWMLLIANSLKVNILEKDRHWVVVQVTIAHLVTSFCFVYIRPAIWNTIWMEVVRLAGCYDLDCLIGDFNARTGLEPQEWIFDSNEEFDWTWTSRVSRDTLINNHGRSVLEFCETAGYLILNGRGTVDSKDYYTYVGEIGCSVIDLALVKLTRLVDVSNFFVLDKVYSNHFPIGVTLDCKVIKKTKERWNRSRDSRVRIFWREKSKEVMSHKYSDLLSAIRNQSVLTFEILDDLIKSSFSDWYQRSVGTCISWFDVDCRLSIARRNQALKRMRRAKIGNSIAVGNFIKERNITRNLCRAKKKLFLKRMNSNLASGDSKQFWRSINFFIGRKRSELPALDWVSYFARKFCFRQYLPDIAVYNWCVNLQDDLLDTEITEQEVNKVLVSMKNGTAPGIDGIPAELYKNHPELVGYLASLFNNVYQSGIIPLDWRICKIIPIFKKRRKDLPENYRPISLLPTISKVFCKILGKRLVMWLNKFEVLSDFQGVKQGCVLSPLLFNLYLFPLVSKLIASELGGIDLLGTEVKVLTYADDLVVMADSPLGLQRLIDILEMALQELNLSVNINKSKIMVFRNGGKHSKRENWFLQEGKIEVVDEYKYLGVFFQSNGRFSKHLNSDPFKILKFPIVNIKIFLLDYCCSLAEKESMYETNFHISMQLEMYK